MTEYDNSLKTPTGRFVGGNLTKYETKDYHGNELEKQCIVIYVAFEKTNLLVQQMHEQIKFIGQSGFPQLFKNGQSIVDFSWKIVDGDSTVPNKKGNIPSQREGYPGNWVLKFKTFYPLKICDRDTNDITDNENYIKLGDFIRVIGSVVPNKSQTNPGVYLNITRVQHAGFGPQIVFANDQPFDKAPTDLPAGASLTPQEPATSVAPAPQSAPPPLPPQGTGVQPANNILDRPVLKRYVLDGKIWNEADLKMAGWSASQLENLQAAT